MNKIHSQREAVNLEKLAKLAQQFLDVQQCTVRLREQMKAIGYEPPAIVTVDEVTISPLSLRVQFTYREDGRNDKGQVFFMIDQHDKLTGDF